MRPSLWSRIGGLVVGFATAVIVIAVAVLPFLTPAWLAFAQDRAGATTWTGYSRTDVRAATDLLVADLLFGPPAFDVEVAGAPVLSERERGHLRDVRGVFMGMVALLVVSVGILAVALVRGRAQPGAWRSVRTGARLLAGGVVLLGVVAAVAFEPAFEVFHRLLFTGNYTFDPRTDRLVQLFPLQLWFETTIALGITIVVVALLVAWASGRRVAQLSEGHGLRGLEGGRPRSGLGEVRP